MTPYPYKVGAKVAGADCIGKPFAGAVTEILGPYTVVLDEIYATPVSLIRGVVENDDEEPACNISGRCDPISREDDISSCRHCGKELRKRDGEWLTWDEDDRREAAAKSAQNIPENITAPASGQLSLF